MKALALFALICGCLLIFSGSLSEAEADRMTLRATNEPRLLMISVYLPDLTDAYRWLSVYGCSADVTESGTFCNYAFERESTTELAGRKQTLIFWRDLPGGTMQITAVAFDVSSQALARGQVTIFRGH